MILLLGIGLAIVVGLLRGGNLRNLGSIRVRWAWLVLVALTMQVALGRLPTDWSGTARLLFPLTHLAILVVAWVNRDLSGMRLFAAGVLLNLVVIVGNGGFMPVEPEALVSAGIAESVEFVPLYSRVAGSKALVLPRAETALWWLSDIIALRPIKTIVSLGDLLMVPGVFLLVEEGILNQEDE
ncbi:MAG: DUF5317 domain-containing protein [Anaerolineae bacterium]